MLRQRPQHDDGGRRDSRRGTRRARIRRSLSLLRQAGISHKAGWRDHSDLPTISFTSAVARPSARNLHEIAATWTLQAERHRRTINSRRGTVSMRHTRERRTHALVTASGCQVDGLVDVREFAFEVGGGKVRIGRHQPVGVVVRDRDGERTIPVADDRIMYAKWALPVAAFLVARAVTRGRRHRSTRRAARRSNRHDER